MNGIRKLRRGVIKSRTGGKGWAQVWKNWQFTMGFGKFFAKRQLLIARIRRAKSKKTMSTRPDGRRFLN